MQGFEVVFHITRGGGFAETRLRRERERERVRGRIDTHKKINMTESTAEESYRIIAVILGWIAFAAWSISFYPQVGVFSFLFFFEKKEKTNRDNA